METPLGLVIRPTREEELDRLMEILAQAVLFMRSQGNLTQWAGNYPNRDHLQEDIRLGRSFVALLDGRIVATFCFTEGPDPTYAVIEHGEWLHEGSYHVIHRMACIERGRGIASACMAWCLDRAQHVRVDTHRDNRPMQQMLAKFGFSRRGIIHIADGSERIAFER